jgi:hypothetical protein
MNLEDTTAAINRVIQSPAFSNKEVLRGLLLYLFDSWKKGIVLKEIDIAVDFFKRGKDFIPGDDTIVRVNIYKLRTLLDVYYKDEGKKDTVKIEIPKGSYSLNFTRHPANQTIVIKKHIKHRILYTICVISVLFNLYFILKCYSNKNQILNPVWNDYLISGHPVYVTLGNPYFFRMNDSVILRDITINSASDLQNSKLNSECLGSSKYSEIDYPYFSSSNVLPLTDIISYFAKAGVDTRLQALSEIKAEDVKLNNCIFIANVNSFGFISKFLDQTSIQLNTSPKQIVIGKNNNRQVLTVPEKVKGFYQDYAFIVKIPGPQQNTLTIMGDFHSSGIKGLTGFLCNQNLFSKFETDICKKYGAFPRYFEMVVKVSSYNYADFKTEVIFFNKLSN